MAQITLDSDTLTVSLSGWDAVWAMHGSLRVPLSHITGVEVTHENGWHYLWKMLGTNAPGVKVAGSFMTGEGLVFCDFSNGNDCISLATTHETYKRIVIQLDNGENADALASRIREQIAVVT
ncbi:MAG: hypothetical protein M3R51_07915 [Candidatus Eremiobacteraeota bacterium]|nr:hypothetical protein [Candidatus Eremiobacteraeota bacterium]